MITPDNWQTPAALAVVALTVVIFTVRIIRRRRSRRSGGGSCGSGCDCPTKPRDPSPDSGTETRSV